MFKRKYKKLDDILEANNGFFHDYKTDAFLEDGGLNHRSFENVINASSEMVSWQDCNYELCSSKLQLRREYEKRICKIE